MATINTFCDPGTINQTLRVDGTNIAGSLTGACSAILGGPLSATGTHTNASDLSVIVNGFENVINTFGAGPGAGNFIGNGCCNTLAGEYSAIVNGRLNNVCGVHSGINNGYGNHILGDNSFVGSGTPNEVGSFVSGIAVGCASIVGGYNNGITDNGTTGANLSFIGGGSDNYVLGISSSIVGGAANQINGICSNIGGGQENKISSATVIPIDFFGHRWGIQKYN